MQRSTYFQVGDQAYVNTVDRQEIWLLQREGQTATVTSLTAGGEYVTFQFEDGFEVDVPAQLADRNFQFVADETQRATESQLAEVQANLQIDSSRPSETRLTDLNGSVLAIFYSPSQARQLVNQLSPEMVTQNEAYLTPAGMNFFASYGLYD